MALDDRECVVLALLDVRTPSVSELALESEVGGADVGASRRLALASLLRAGSCLALSLCLLLNASAILSLS